MKVSEHIMLSNEERTFTAYESELESNLKFILRKYSHLDRSKVRDLLEELDNSRDLAVQILDEEESHCNNILEEKKLDRKKSLNLTQEEENRILKQSFLNLYKKLIAKTDQLKDLEKKYDSERLENVRLKQMNKFLMQGEYSQGRREDETPIC